MTTLKWQFKCEECARFADDEDDDDDDDDEKQTPLYQCLFPKCPLIDTVLCRECLKDTHKRINRKKKLKHEWMPCDQNKHIVSVNTLQLSQTNLNRKLAKMEKVRNFEKVAVVWKDYMEGDISWDVCTMGVMKYGLGSDIAACIATGAVLGVTNAAISIGAVEAGLAIGSLAGPAGTVIGGIIGGLVAVASTYAHCRVAENAVNALTKVPKIPEPDDAALVRIIEEALQYFHLKKIVNDESKFNMKTVEKEFRQYARFYHPDRPDGDEKRFLELQCNYGTMRALFDKTQKLNSRAVQAFEKWKQQNGISN